MLSVLKWLMRQEGSEKHVYIFTLLKFVDLLINLTLAISQDEKKIDNAKYLKIGE